MNLCGGGDSPDSNEAKVGMLGAYDLIEKANLGKSGVVNRRSCDAARPALEEWAPGLVDHFRGNAIHHDQRVRVRGESLDEGYSERFVGDVADFDEQRF